MNGIVAVSVVAYLVLLGMAVWLTDQCQREIDLAIALRKPSTLQ